ncbi:related to potassium transporter TRK-1 [Ramularia collo-cygni]|uniref:Related to potassium transporter TRK-1 n=1 Tax=Ramularia collo-cygni TaxID=112498 RepID=A0A2D3V4J8_9PEZI|nr:related to potassium transporter TRK-1 [Ramularia collo-cygni]CZT20370.1 related to potassium transporter TRK-1 [Ramularia collo-cygni]
MWRPPINYVILHYTWILFCCLLAFLILSPEGNLQAIDAFFFACSANTESGVDVKDLKTYQQLVLYFFPIVTNLGFVNIAVVVVRLYWFRKQLKRIDPSLLKPSHTKRRLSDGADSIADPEHAVDHLDAKAEEVIVTPKDNLFPSEKDGNTYSDPQSISWATDTREAPIHRRTLPQADNDDTDEITVAADSRSPRAPPLRRTSTARSLTQSMTVGRIASSMFIIGESSESRSRRTSRSPSRSLAPSKDSRRSTVSVDWDAIGGIEYRSLKLLLKIVIGYFVGIHLFGVICLIPWIHNAPSKYTDYLKTQGQNKTWWAIYSSQTMVSNLGFTLTADSMISFADATWPMLVLSFLAYAGNTCYPVFLRLLIVTMRKIVPKRSAMQEPLTYLLDHPRRCYTLLFPRGTTWALFGIVFVMNLTDVVLIIILDLKNTAVNYLPPGPRVLAAIFQSASARHTGTASFNLASVNPAVQFSLLVMMYIAVFPLAISTRTSNVYDDRPVGMMKADAAVYDGQSPGAYLMNHLRNQLSFDLWYIFLGIFCLCVNESSRIADNADPAFSVFAMFFEVVSAYGNVGLSLGYPGMNYSLSGEFKIFSKLVICAMMIRGRHRGLPYTLDRAIVLPEQPEREEQRDEKLAVPSGYRMKKYNTT